MGDPLNGLVFILNPASASGQTGRQWKKLSKRIAEQAGKEVKDIRVLESERPQHATELTRNALRVRLSMVLCSSVIFYIHNESKLSN
jgi:hypothetical protein